MAEFKPYSITRGGFATPRELFMSVVKDMTEFHEGSSSNAFEIVYPTDISDLDYTDTNSPLNDVLIVRATNHVDPCVDDGTVEQPWVMRFDTRTSIGHGMGHINVTTPLQIDWSKVKAPAIPYIPPDTAYDPNSVTTQGSLGYIGWRVPDGDGNVSASDARGFINRSVYHTNVTQVQQTDEYGNLIWELSPLSGSGSPIEIWSSRRLEPTAGLDELGRVAYTTELVWYELMNSEDVLLTAVWDEQTPARAPEKPTADQYTQADGIVTPIYQERKCTLKIQILPCPRCSKSDG